MSFADSVRRGRVGMCRAARPGLEALEGRALLAVAAFDPTFGTGGVALGPVDAGAGTVLSRPTAVAVQGDGKIVQVGAYGINATGGSAYGMLAVRRYNADGSADTSFGAAGQATIPLPSGGVDVSTAPIGLAIRPDGSVVVAATRVVAQLTPAGQPDPGFGTGGEFVLPLATAGQLNAVALLPDGKVIAAGPRTNGGGGVYTDMVTIRLTTAGAFDPSYNGTGELVVAIKGTNGYDFSSSASVVGVEAAPGGGVILAANENIVSRYGGTIGLLYRITAAGAPDASYGGSGYVYAGPLNAITVRSDGSVVVAGAVYAPYVGVPSPSLVQYRPDGGLDTAFRGLPPDYQGPQVGPYDVLTSVVIDADGGVTAGGTSGSNQLVARRFTAAGQADPTFGLRGRIAARALPPYNDRSFPSGEAVTGVAVDATGRVIVSGTDTQTSNGSTSVRSLLGRFVAGPLRDSATDDFDGDGKSDVAAQLANLGIFAYRASTRGDTITSFGVPGVGATIPAVGDYDGDGIPDVGAYIPAYGFYAYRQSSRTSDVVVAFGSAGAGASIPAPGDYNGDGLTDVAVYLPAFGQMAIAPTYLPPNGQTPIEPPGGGAPYLVPFGPAGAGASIPAPGDYDGDGKTDVAVYLPAYGAMAVHPSSGGLNQLIPFGPAGVGAAIPAPGDYDGDGKTDVAVYLPAYGALAVHPSGGGFNQLIPFGPAGIGASIPAPGDYDGDGKTDVAVYLPASGQLAIHPSGGGLNYLVGFGAPGGAGATVPASSSPFAFGATVSSSALREPAAGAGYLVALTDDLLPAERQIKKPRT